jgi:hypothetical protein
MARNGRLRNGQLRGPREAAGEAECGEGALGGPDPTRRIERARQPEEGAEQLPRPPGVVVAIGPDHPDAQVGSEVALRTEIPGGAESECGQSELGASDVDLQPVPEGVDDRNEIAQVLVTGVDADQVVEPIGELDQHAHGDLVTH